MPDLRTDWLTARTVLIAENRANRPSEFDINSPSTSPVSGGAASPGLPSTSSGPEPVEGSLSNSAAGRPRPSCPFCPGNESDTPPAQYQQLDEQNQWRLRIMPNKYPFVSDTVETRAPVASTSTSAGGPPAATSSPAFGIHEVIVETARHVDRTSALSERELRHVLEAYAVRLRHWSTDRRLNYGLVFKNQGPRAGASLAHLHSQLVALPAIPHSVNAELGRAKDSYADRGSCAYCQLIAQERRAGVRVVHDHDGYIAFCPFASVQPCEVWLMPANHEPFYEQVESDNSWDRLARMLREVVVGIETLIPSASFNMLLRTAAWNGNHDASFHWRIELQPRMNAIAGLESATGIYVNPVSPEHAAERLRNWPK